MSFRLPQFNAGGAPPGISAGLGPMSSLPNASFALQPAPPGKGNQQFAMGFNTNQNPNGNFGGFRI